MAANQTKPQLTISLLISNRPDSIRKCLDSLRPIMEQIPSELILVDTSKNPQIHEMLFEYTNQVYEFDWCDDFSKARNVGLKKAKGEWFLFLDDDEWFVEIDALVDFFRSGDYKKYGYAHYQVRNFYDPSYTYYSDSWVSRMIRIDADTEFRSKIHEYMYPVRGEYKYIYAMAYHSGYIFATEEQKRAHFERNSKLLLKMIEEEPKNIRWKIQMAQEYRSVKELETLCEFCEKCLVEVADLNGESDAIHLGTFYVAYIDALIQLKKYNEAKQICQRTLLDKRNTKLCIACVELALAELAFREQDWKEAQLHVDAYFKIQRELDRNQDAFEEMSRALIVQEAYDDISVKKAYSILIACDLKLNNSTKILEEYYEKLEWDKDVIYAFLGIEKVFVWAMATMEYIPLFTQIAQDAYRNMTLREYICQAAQEWNGTGNAFAQVMNVFAQIEIDDWYIWYARMIDGDAQKDGIAVKTAMKGFFETAQNIFNLPEKIYEIAESYQILFAEYWLEVSPDRFQQHVKEYVRVAGEEHLAKTAKRIEVCIPKEHWKQRFFQLALLEREIARGPKDPTNLIEFVNVMVHFSENTITFYGEYYKEDVFMNYPNLLPREVQAAIKFLEFVELEQQDRTMALESLKEAAVCYPFFADGIRKFMVQYPELERQRMRKQKEELRNLRNQVVEQVKDLLNKGQADEAIAIVAQLKQMVPNDLEVVALGLEARLASLERNEG